MTAERWIANTAMSTERFQMLTNCTQDSVELKQSRHAHGNKCKMEYQMALDDFFSFT